MRANAFSVQHSDDHEILVFEKAWKMLCIGLVILPLKLFFKGSFSL
jgi:hypothetical protein